MIPRTPKNIVSRFQEQMQSELNAILSYWHHHTIDYTNGGFWGKVNNENIADTYAPKGVVLHARILWTFSAAHVITRNEEHLQIAERAYYYLLQNFRDEEYGGVYWSVDYKGNRLETKKQIYGLAFTLYGMSAYYRATKQEAALRYAIHLFTTIEQYSFDEKNNGYYEAFTRDWKNVQDLRLSEKDVNASKTMNTHLHIIEAYASLYTVWQDDVLKQKIENLLLLFDKYFINKKSGHLILFFDDTWHEQPDVISYGHDIEAAWLLLQCAEVIGDEKWIAIYRQHAVQIAAAASEGLHTDGGLWYEFDVAHNKLIKQKHWWPQAEAMIGFMNAYQITGLESDLQKSWQSWLFTQNYLLDTKNGEWFWGVDDSYTVMPGEDKAGFWKCPYHNARACMEIIKRTAEIVNQPYE